MFGVKRKFVRDVIRACLLAWLEMLFDPGVLFDLALEHLLRAFDAASCQIFPFRNHAHADHIVVLWDVPEPSFLRHKRNGGRACIDAVVALRVFVIGPDGDLVKHWIFDAPLIADGRKRFFARAIECDARAIFGDRAVIMLRANSNHSACLAKQSSHRYFLVDSGAFFAGMLHHHLVEFRTKHLPGLRHILIVSRKEIKRLRSLSRHRNELDAVLFDERRLLHLVEQTEALERVVGKRQERFAHMIARKFFTFEHQHIVAHFSQHRRCGTTCGTAADNYHLVFFAMRRGLLAGYLLLAHCQAGGRISTISANGRPARFHKVLRRPKSKCAPFKWRTWLINLSEAIRKKPRGWLLKAIFDSFRMRPRGQCSSRMAAWAASGKRSRLILIAPNSTGLLLSSTNNATSRKYSLPLRSRPTI